MDRMEEIKSKIIKWYGFELQAEVNDIMPDLIYLYEKLEELQRDSLNEL